MRPDSMVSASIYSNGTEGTERSRRVNQPNLSVPPPKLPDSYAAPYRIPTLDHNKPKDLKRRQENLAGKAEEKAGDKGAK